MLLVADCGNTAVKLGLAEDGRVRTAARLPPADPDLGAFLDMHDQAVAGLVVLPGAGASAAIVRRWWARMGRGRPLRTVGEDIPLPRVEAYPGLGVDRIVAGLAADWSGVVVDAGTATTLSAWHSHGPRFLGGLILPGAAAAMAGLAAAAPALPRVDPGDPDCLAAQRSTAGALAAAMGIGYGPMVAACLLKLQRETGQRTVTATGGGIDLLVRSAVIRPAAVRPHLVLDGLARLAQEHPPC